MLRKSLGILAVIVVIALGAIYGGKLAGIFGHQHAGSTAAANSGGGPAERKVLFWYDAMNAEHHYDKPGKAPDGMDLVPQYADDGTQTVAGQAGDMSNPASSTKRPGSQSRLHVPATSGTARHARPGRSRSMSRCSRP
jgi:Heavy metal binding domain